MYMYDGIGRKRGFTRLVQMRRVSFAKKPYQNLVLTCSKATSILRSPQIAAIKQCTMSVSKIQGSKGNDRRQKRTCMASTAQLSAVDFDPLSHVNSWTCYTLMTHFNEPSQSQQVDFFTQGPGQKKMSLQTLVCLVVFKYVPLPLMVSGVSHNTGISSPSSQHL